MPYLDHAGAALPTEQQIRDVLEFSLATRLANPHSNHHTAFATRLMMEDARARAVNNTKLTGPMFAYLRDSHNSVVGMREIVKDRADSILCVNLCEDLPIAASGSLFVMTAMSNFCGKKYDLSLIGELERKDSTHLLAPHIFAGGTVSQILVDTFHSVLKNQIEESLEHGTPNYFAVCTLSKGFADLKRYGKLHGKPLCRYSDR
uniref:Nitroreductase domain-containing protein n=1 Tax=Angiostrongylus cantonensis TaxID=6313 RepID=A0A0K0DQ99_ANGCA